jgi:hypothetical protein
VDRQRRRRDRLSIERSLDGVTFAEVATVGPDVTSYVDGGLAKLTRYTYRVRALNASGYSVYSNTAAARTRSR